MILLTKKSVASKILSPNTDTCANALDESADGIATTNSMAPNTQVVNTLDFPFSLNAATMISYRLKEDVSVANKNNNKKMAKKTCPKGISANAAGNTINNKPGPSVRLNPKANT